VNNKEENCPLGYYCPSDDKKVPCPLGTYGEAAGQTTEAAGCQPCDAGYACNEMGLAALETKCDGGYYCTGSAVTQRPNGATDGGYICEPGYYCPQGSTAPTACTGGSYCASFGLSEVSGQCEAGYSCPTGLIGSTSPREVTCTAGSYCEAGSAAPTVCPTGTYTESVGTTSLDQCLDCPFGTYCAAGIRVTPNGCVVGYYCSPGSAVDMPVECQAGYECPADSAY